jgi:membrane protein implicated in regulation of membrane protease activity
MHHLLWLLVLLALIFFLFLPWRLALDLFAGIMVALIAVLLMVSRKRRPRDGAPGRVMVGTRAEVVRAEGKEGEVRWQGELWHAVSSEILDPGEEVVIEDVDGLTLHVRKNIRN